MLQGKLYYSPERLTIIMEPFLAPFIIRQNRCHDMIEGFGMIHLYPVGEFVNDNIIYDLLGGKDEPPVEVQVAKAAAASPAGLLFADRDAVVGDVHYGCVVGSFLGEHCTCDLAIAVTFRGWKGWTLRER